MSLIARIPKRVAALVLAFLIPCAAFAEHFKFHIVFTSGTLAGHVYTGYFTTQGPKGAFTPDGPMGSRLMSLSISIDGAVFKMHDDKDFPFMPLINYDSGPLCDRFDFDASKGSTTALHDKWVYMYCVYGAPQGEISFGTWRSGEKVQLAKGWFYDVVRIEEREAPPETGCSLCHEKLRR
jgi:hypothetical protein